MAGVSKNFIYGVIDEATYLLNIEKRLKAEQIRKRVGEKTGEVVLSCLGYKDMELVTVCRALIAYAKYTTEGLEVALDVLDQKRQRNLGKTVIVNDEGILIDENFALGSTTDHLVEEKYGYMRAIETITLQELTDMFDFHDNILPFPGL
ncbi:MAG: hypothetical protein ACREF5_02890 [Candidatus Saccharimonadales bacterium]